MSAPRIVYVVSEQGGYVPVLAGDPSNPGAPSQAFIVWRPSGNGGDATTFSEVMALLGSNPGAVIYCDDPLIETTQYVVPAGTYDMHEAWFVSPGESEQEINLDVGAVLQNLRGIRDVLLQGLDSVGQLTFPRSQPNSVFSVVGTGQDAGFFSAGGGPVISMPDSTSLLITMSGFAVLNGAGAVTLGATCHVNVQCQDITNPTAIGDDSFATTHADSTLDIFQDGSLSPPVFAAFAGTDARHALGMTAGFGTTAQRPVTPSTGTLFYDTTVPAFIVWDGAAWKTVTVT